MRKIFTLIALVFAAGPMLAQYTMTRSDFPQIGDSQYYSEADTTGLTPGPGGTGQTWDFSGAVQLGSSLTVNWGDATMHPNGGMFPGSDIVQTFSNEYNFFASNNDSMVHTGEVSLTGTDLPYSDPGVLWYFPLNFNDMNSDSVFGEYFDGFLTNANRWGEVSTHFDGDGTVITPFATYNNVNRLYTQGIYQDSSWTGAVNTEVQVFRWEWYQQGRTLPVMSINVRLVSVNAGPFTETTSIWYADSQLVNVDAAIAAAEMQVYPNPTAGNA
ncbi:MAG: hypothetical protein AAF570_14285, partial [Bacteroidota bacterium]